MLKIYVKVDISLYKIGSISLLSKNWSKNYEKERLKRAKLKSSIKEQKWVQRKVRKNKYLSKNGDHLTKINLILSTF